MAREAGWDDVAEQAVYQLGRYALMHNDPVHAETLLRAVCTEEDANAMNVLGLALKKQDRFEEAVGLFEHVVALRPKSAQAHHNLATTYRALKRNDDAVVSMREAVRLDPESLPMRNDLADCLRRAGHDDEALAIFSRLVKEAPDYSPAVENLSTMCRKVGAQETDLQTLTQALPLHEDRFGLQFGTFEVLYLSGNYDQAWEQYECRFSDEDQARNSSESRWRGQDLNGGTLRVTTEQGLGDIAHFIRLIPLLKERIDGDLVVESYYSLYRLINYSFDVEVVLPRVVEDIEEDYFVPLLSLPHELGGLSPIEVTGDPYLDVHDEIVRRWSCLLNQRREVLNVGINWMGSAQKKGLHRALHLSDFGSLTGVENVSFYALQKGEGREQMEAYAPALGLQDIGTHVSDYYETAGAMKALDLIITNDTSVAHVAGGLGCPTWVLVAAGGCWRWGNREQTTDWYPRTRLFRQDEAGDWSAPMQRVRTELIRAVNDRSQHLRSNAHASA